MADEAFFVAEQSPCHGEELHADDRYSEGDNRGVLGRARDQPGGGGQQGDAGSGRAGSEQSGISEARARRPDQTKQATDGCWPRSPTAFPRSGHRQARHTATSTRDRSTTRSASATRAGR